MNVKEALVEMKDLLSKGWTQNSFAKDAKGGESVMYFSENATCFCIHGAAMRAIYGGCGA